MRLLSIRNIFFRLLVLVTMVLVTSACLKTVKQSGYRFNEEDIDQLVIGVTSQRDVLRLLGTPSLRSNLGQEKWYYIMQEHTSVGFSKPKMRQQDVLEILFADNSVADVRRFNKDDAQKVSYNEDETKIEGRDITVMEQLLGNIGRFSNPPTAAE